MLDRPNAAADLIRGEGLSVRVGGALLIDKVDIAVAGGMIVTIVGPNGGGKTTLIKALIGLMPLQSGRVVRRSDLRIGYVPQHFKPDPVLPLTVDRFIGLAGRTFATTRAEALARVGAERLSGRPLAALSGGELRRVLLARALVRDPSLLVLDEPVAGVDVAGQPALYGIIAELAKRSGIGVLMVSHDMHLVMAASTHVLCLNRHVCCEGQPETITRHPEYVALFGAEWSDGLAFYTHHHDHEHDAAGNVVHGGHAHHAGASKGRPHG